MTVISFHKEIILLNIIEMRTQKINIKNILDPFISRQNNLHNFADI